MTLDGKVCIVTGGGSGIGEAAAIQIAAEGARLVLVGRTMSKLVRVAETIQSRGGSASTHALDVADRDAVLDMAAGVRKDMGGIDVLVNNAGHNSYHRRLLTTTPEDLTAVFDSNVFGSIYCAQAVVPTMFEAGGGTIINVASRAGVAPGLPAGLAYCATKAALINFTAYLNAEFEGTGIRASAVMPGEVDTPMLDGSPLVPDPETRAAMMGAEAVAEAITMIARPPQASVVTELAMMPSVVRDYLKQAEATP